MINNHEAKHRLLDKYLVTSGPWALRPGLPADGDLYSDEDRGGITFRYNAALTKWLSTQLYSFQLQLRPGAAAANSLAATTANALYASHPDNASDLYITAVDTTVDVVTTNSGVSYWTMTLRFRNSAIGNSGITIVADTSAGAPGVMIPLGVSPSPFLLSPGTLALPQIVTRANFYDALVDFAKAGSTGTPGNINFKPVTVWYRLVG